MHIKTIVLQEPKDWYHGGENPLQHNFYFHGKDIYKCKCGLIIKEVNVFNNLKSKKNEQLNTIL